MLLQEFTKLTGFTPTDEYFNGVIHPLYMATQMDKESWCKQWKRKGGIQTAYNVKERPQIYGDIKPLSESDRVAILEAEKHERNKFEKRLNSYLKRYGVSKLHTWTYWRDA